MREHSADALIIYLLGRRDGHCAVPFSLQETIHLRSHEIETLLNDVSKMPIADRNCTLGASHQLIHYRVWKNDTYRDSVRVFGDCRLALCQDRITCSRQIGHTDQIRPPAFSKVLNACIEIHLLLSSFDTVIFYVTGRPLRVPDDLARLPPYRETDLRICLQIIELLPGERAVEKTNLPEG
jgi:hypothetical protein